MGLLENTLSLRASAHTGVAIPKIFISFILWSWPSHATGRL